MIVISKIELEGTDNLQYTDIGYTEDDNLANQINEDYDATLGKFLAENRTKLAIGEASVSTFFATTDSVNEARTEVDNVEGLDIPLITNVNEL
tara:strand:- start:2860 stop:3138 length:279 start_codon:yes stop_codon:yes gene_type:complete